MSRRDRASPWAGQWRIRTEMSTYDLDFDRHEVVRRPGAGALAARTDGRRQPLVRVIQCDVGEPLRFLMRGGDGLARSWQSETPVVEAVRVPR